ncbi:hypothetical protein HUJ04_008913 [Dendroctonus ponderosae]|nr:hypothetical protein HUJ04_008913 [Dendroctonus ponderosae]
MGKRSYSFRPAVHSSPKLSTRDQLDAGNQLKTSKKKKMARIMKVPLTKGVSIFQIFKMRAIGMYARSDVEQPCSFVRSRSCDTNKYAIDIKEVKATEHL